MGSLEEVIRGGTPFGSGRVAQGLAGLSAAIVLGLPAGVEAFQCKAPEDRPHLSLRWEGRVLPYGVHAQSDLPVPVVQAAFEVWSQVECSDLAFEYVGLVAESDPVSQVLAVTAGWEAAGRSWEAVAITETRFHPNTGWIDSADIQVNEELYVFGDTEGACAGGIYDLSAVLTHEAGHFLGLGHTEQFTGGAEDPTMAPRVSECEADKRSLEPDDVAGICHLYPVGGPTGRCDGLPDQEGYIDNTAFGCRSARGPTEAVLWLALGAALLAIRRDTCPGIRSGG